MENDSLNVTDSTYANLPSAEQLGISISVNPIKNITVGDTFEFPVTISWSAPGSALLVVPTSSVNAKGLIQLGVSQESSRKMHEGKEIASVTFNYKILAEDTGNLQLPVLRFEIPTVNGGSIDLKSESVPLQVNAPFNILPFAVGIFVFIILLVAGLWRHSRHKNSKMILEKNKNFKNSLQEQMSVLKQRVSTANAKDWLLELENICKNYLQYHQQNSKENNIDKLVKGYGNEDWNLLLEKFAHARYGLVKQDPFELKEIWKLATKLMNLEE